MTALKRDISFATRAVKELRAYARHPNMPGALDQAITFKLDSLEKYIDRIAAEVEKHLNDKGNSENGK